eukprot:3343032-Amphidinium_carterae.1
MLESVVGSRRCIAGQGRLLSCSSSLWELFHQLGANREAQLTPAPEEHLELHRLGSRQTARIALTSPQETPNAFH